MTVTAGRWPAADTHTTRTHVDCVRLACAEHLGTLAAGRTVRTGTVAADTACTSAYRSPGSHYARRHTFTLDSPAWVDIDLAKTTTSSLDPYVLLIEGHDNTGTALAQDDNTGTGTAAQIRNRYLEAGTYTIEATTATATGNTSTGAYTLTVTVPIHGLPNQIDATVDEQTTINFTYWPTTAGRATAVSSTLTALDTAASASNGVGSVTVLPHLVREHQVTLGLTVPGPQGTRSTQSMERSRRSVPERLELVEHEFGVVSVCPEGETAGSAGGVLCGRAKTPDVEPDYKVTPGTLIGTRKAVRESLLERFANPFASCGVTENQIIALMLSIGYRELPIHDGRDYNRYVARSPMGMGRSDMNHRALWPEGDISRLDATQTTPDRFVLAPRTIASQAFWHAGVGLWQLDDPRSDYRKLNHAERASTTVGGRLVADYWRDEICDVAPAALDQAIREAYQPWLACRLDKDGDNEVDSEPCYDIDYKEIYTPRVGSMSPDGLNVSTKAPENAGDFDVAGGVPSRACRWGTAGDEIDCWFVNTAAPQGRIIDYDPAAKFSDSWWYDVDEDDPTKSAWKRVRGPLAVPFISFTHEEHRYAVFPSSILDARAAGPGSTAYTMIKRVAQDTNVRLSHTDTPWERDDHGGDVLYVKFCGGPSGVATNDVTCEWVSVNSAGFAARMGVSSGGG